MIPPCWYLLALTTMVGRLSLMAFAAAGRTVLLLSFFHFFMAAVAAVLVEEFFKLLLTAYLVKHLVNIFTFKTRLRLIALMGSMVTSRTGVIISILKVSILLIPLQELILMVMMREIVYMFFITFLNDIRIVLLSV